MTGEELARSWKDPESREEPAEEHPAGRIQLGAAIRTGARSALLAGMMGVTAFSELLGDGGTDISYH